MQIDLTPEQSDFIGRAVNDGRLRRAEDAIREGLELWIARERRRDEVLATIDAAEDSLARGAGIPITAEAMRELADDVKRRGRERIAVRRRRAE